MRLANVNTTDLRAAIELGCRTMSRVFNADDNDIPFFASELRPNQRLAFNSCHSEAHVPGRHLNALLAAEELGFKVSEEAIEAHAAALRFSYSGAVPLPLNRERLDGPLINFCPHNVREGFHGLYALVVHRASHWAADCAERSIKTILGNWRPDRGWEGRKLERLGLQNQGWDAPFITGLARAIGPLVKLHIATDSTPALKLAQRLAEKATGEFFTPDGHYDPERFGTHVHSTTCVMSSLAQLANLTQDDGLMERVKAFYDNGLWQVRDALGWSIENSRPEASPDMGEGNNTGDILETALLLGQYRWPEYLAEAELILRAHLLPSQLRDTSFIAQPDNPRGEDGLRDLADRHLGAWGFPAPYGHCPVGQEWLSFNMDIVGGVVGSLCEAERARLSSSRETLRLAAELARLLPAEKLPQRKAPLFVEVTSLFDYEDEDLVVQSPYTHNHGSLVLTTRHRLDGLTVLLPPWVDPATLRIEGAAEAGTPRPEGALEVDRQGQLFSLFGVPAGHRLAFCFPLAERELVLQHRTHDIRVRLRGDEVVAMDNFGADLTYFDPYE